MKKDTIDSDQLNSNKSKTTSSLNDDQTNTGNSGSSSNSSSNGNNGSSTNNYQNQPFKCLANSIEPRFLLAMIVDRLESHKKVDVNASTAMGGGGVGCGAPGGAQQTTSSSAGVGASGGNSAAAAASKVKCVPSARTINCPHHCVAILATRLFAILCNEPAFQQKLVSNEHSDACFNLIIEILYPNNDPVGSLFPIFLNFLIFIVYV